jgi:hypothetical protein
MGRLSAALVRANEMASHGLKTVTETWQRVNGSVNRGFRTTTVVAGDAYNSALDWKDNGEISRWLTKHLSHQAPTAGSKAMDAEYLQTHIGGGWHRLYDGGHSLAGSWRAVSEALPNMSALDQLAPGPTSTGKT